MRSGGKPTASCTVPITLSSDVDLHVGNALDAERDGQGVHCNREECQVNAIHVGVEDLLLYCRRFCFGLAKFLLESFLTFLESSLDFRPVDKVRLRMQSSLCCCCYSVWPAPAVRGGLGYVPAAGVARAVQDEFYQLV